MKKDFNLSLTPKQASDETYYRPVVASKLGVDPTEIGAIVVRRRSIDARQRQIKINLGVRVYMGEEPEVEHQTYHYGNVSGKTPVGIVGSGPAGLFAALRLIELGYKPVIFERGKNVSDRKRDIAKIHREHLVDPDSNYGYGEGGAGTFSDGKLYTRSKKRGSVEKILEILVQFGADPQILIDAHPHIGTNKLPGVIARIREQILASGGEIYFNSRVTDLILKGDQCTGLVLNDGNRFECASVVLATGHSARDIYEMLYRNGVNLEAKTFAMGVRIEHPQALIDTIQYHQDNRGPYLPAATYSFVEQVNDRGVYSFCMCPGGFIVPAATAPGELVVNGMSASKRNSPFANSGLVVEVRPEDLREFQHYGVFAGLEFQKSVEKLCFQLNGHSQFAPAQRISDFVAGRRSADLPDSSYTPGLVSSSLHEKLPKRISSRLREGIVEMDRKARGFHTDQGVVVGVESRTSSPLRIPRDEESLQHIRVKNLYPCGEGAGYAGGIASSAIDGERCADALAEKLK
ncbi:NAD(P)/FAD-dependent oxidoreductase [Mangrovibacterium lignilyticum]|uniref:NAD(P)/FAD-dependent oxidoreductase n=1 Tax=Mangrovibacterium lignilyticum TaxID=2668052 RepID=UPI0013D821EC|nr:FAD-binding protein [Mangrovibacterium lignilyticum]